jgi:hypothetical protein
MNAKFANPVWHLVDARGQTLGRMATQIAHIIRVRSMSVCHYVLLFLSVYAFCDELSLFLVQSARILVIN